MLRTSTDAEFLGAWENSDLLAEEDLARGVAPTEAVLAALIEGVDLQQIAIERERSIETVRSQVKSSLRKVGAHSQAGLVGIFSTIPKFLTAAQGHPPSLAPTEAFLTRDDGRRVSYTTSGPVDGILYAEAAEIVLPLFKG